MNLIEFGDCRDIMRKWAKDGIKAQTCVTSPPYFGLRDYGHAGQIGLEETPEQYIAEMVDVFRCVRDVLADDGTLWLNIGDSYAANRSYQVPSTKGGRKHSVSQAAGGKRSVVPDGLKPKDLIGVPWMLAFALRDDGWYLRQDIVWNKPNAMPESVTDRCVRSHEYIFLLSKSKKYYFDYEAIREESTSLAGAKKRKRSVWSVNTSQYKGAHSAVFPKELIRPCIIAGAAAGGVVLDPFMGSGTTAIEAINSGRQYLGCEINPENKKIQDDRLSMENSTEEYYKEANMSLF